MDLLTPVSSTDRTRRVAIVMPIAANGDCGGAERFYVGLRDVLSASGVEAELVGVANDESGFEAIKRSYLGCYDLDLSAFGGVITSKAPAYVVRHPNHVCYLMHTMRVFYDMFAFEYPRPTPELFEQRRLVHALDTAALQPSRIRQLFAIGVEVAERLLTFNGLSAQVMRPASTLCGLRQGEFRHLLLPGRLHRWKRVDLAIEAMGHVQAPIELLITGVGEDAPHFNDLARHDRRIRFLGQVPDEQLAALYADALAVLFLPRNEDLGLVTLEAFLSGTPVITCTDSGEPARLVRDGASGLVCPPDPRRIAACIDRLVAAPDEARAMGQCGAASIVEISWHHVGQTLAAALGLADAAGEIMPRAGDPAMRRRA